MPIRGFLSTCAARRGVRAGLVVVAGLLAAAGPARAQATFRPVVRFTPALGLYLPFSGYIINEPQRGAVPALSKRQIHTGIAYGRLALWPRPRLGLEATLAYGRGMVAVKDSTQPRVVADIGSTLWLANLTGMYRLVPDTRRRLSIFTGAGVGLVGRSGQAWEDTPARTKGTVVLLAGGSAALGYRNDGPAFRFQLEDHISWAQFNVGLPSQTRARLHHDLIWTLGATVNVWRFRP